MGAAARAGIHSRSTRNLALAGAFLCLVSVLAVGGCSTNWAERSEAFARDGGATAARVEGLGFQHVAYLRGVTAESAELHIYFGGDGTPMLNHRQVSVDPTPREPMALRMMLRDPNPSAYVGRPCYEGHANDPGCTPLLWTLNRYSEAIVASMATAVSEIIAQAPHARVSLIGYSGGGVLALLVGNRLDRVDQVVTIAANLDIDAWCRLHGYTLLSGSINPIRRTRWRSTLQQIHFAGAEDRNVPPSILRAYVEVVPTASLYVVEGFDHRCCWADYWPTFVESIDLPGN